MIGRALLRTARFLNILDPDQDQLSPVRMQAWLATGQMVGVAADAFWTHHGDAVTSGASLLWAALAHATHQLDKNNRAKNKAYAFFAPPPAR